MKLERSNLVQVHHRRELIEIDFFSTILDSSLDSDFLQLQIPSITRQREGLQHLKIELKAGGIAISEIIEVQSRLNAQMEDNEVIASNSRNKLVNGNQLFITWKG